MTIEVERLAGPQAQGPPGPPRLEKAGPLFPAASAGSMALLTPGFRTSGLQN